jgi:hypothetical protein
MPGFVEEKGACHWVGKKEGEYRRGSEEKE